MNTSVKVLLFLIIIVFLGVAAIIGFGQIRNKSGSQPISTELKTPIATDLQPIVRQPIITIPATGGIDEAADAVLASIADDQSLLDEEELDVSLIESDSQLVIDVGQSYNEKEL